MLRTSTSVLLLLTFSFGVSVFAQRDSSSVDRRKLRTLAIAAGTGYTAGLITLNHVWYKNTERQSFHFFNDNAEWKQVDKAGHFFAAFQLSDISSRTLRSCNLSQRKADIYGALSGFLLTLPIEIFDGYSDGYGASAGDAAADAIGPLFFFGQKIAWGEIRIYPKFSFQRSGYAPLRPALLGDNLLSEVVKDYNGQTYWWSFDVDRFTKFPKWLNVAVGYGAEDMIYARDGENEARGFKPFRQYYLALDFDVTSLRTRSRVLKTIFYLLNTVRLPAPALEISSRGSKFHPFYF